MNRDAGLLRRPDKGGALFPPDKEPMSATIDLLRARHPVPPRRAAAAARAAGPVRRSCGRRGRTRSPPGWTRISSCPVVAAEGAMGRITVVSDPALIRYLLIENADGYRKDDLQRRVLAPGLGNGLLSAEGDEWRLQRRTLAPIFNARTVQGFSDAMNAAGARLGRRLARRAGKQVDVALEMTRVTLDVLERTIFTQGLPSDPDALGRAITRFLEAVGPIDPLDVFGVPDFVPADRPAAGAAGRAILRRGGRRADRPAQGADGAGRGAPGPPHPAAGRAGSRDRQRALGPRREGEHRHLHRGRPRDHGQFPDLDALLPVAGSRRAGADRGRGRRGGAGGFRRRSACPSPGR